MFFHPSHHPMQFQQQQQPQNDQQPHFVIIIMAAGEGKRMNSSLPKVLHPFLQKPMLIHILETVQKVSPKKIFVVTGKHQEMIQKKIDQYRISSPNIQYIQQPNPLGTGDAIKCCLSELDPNDYVLILNGDMPCVSEELIVDFVNQCDEAGFVSMELENPFGYGRILKNGKKEFQGMREERDCNEEEKKIREVNAGIYYFQSMILKTYIPKIQNENQQKEYYLTDIFQTIQKYEDLEYHIHKIPTSMNYQLMGVNTQEELQRLEKIVSSK